MIKLKLYINILNITKSPNIGAILGQKGISIRDFINLIKKYLLYIKLDLLFLCILFILDKKIILIIIKRPSIFSLLKYYLKYNNFIDINFNNIKEKIFPIIFNKIYLIKKKDINCTNINSFFSIFIGNLKSFGIKNVIFVK